MYSLSMKDYAKGILSPVQLGHYVKVVKVIGG